MSYVDRHLLAGESVTYRTRLHWKVYSIPLLLAVVVLLPLGIWALSSEHKVLALIPLGLASAALAGPYLQRRCSEFAVTNKRVIIKLGVWSTRSIELLLSKIEAIAVTQSLMGRMLGYGEIVVTGSGGTKEDFAGIQAPLEFRQAVQAATESKP